MKFNLEFWASLIIANIYLANNKYFGFGVWFVFAIIVFIMKIKHSHKQDKE